MAAEGFLTHRVSGPLGDWTSVHWAPPGLAGVVEGLWHFEGRTAHPRERVLPNGLFELIVHLRGRYSLVRDRGVERCALMGVSGLQTRPFVVQAPGGASTVLGIQLTPVGAYRVFGLPLHELTALDIALDDIVGRAADVLAERCQAAATPEHALRAAAAWLAARVAAGPEVEPAVEWVAGRIRGRRGHVAIAPLREAAGLTTSRLATLFRQQIGATPKIYARLHRFQHAVARLRDGRSSLTDVALATGYYDQPHLNAEFRELSGLTPAALAASLRYDVGVNVPEG
jgi:methylphosphotriester-DNA--protein-cysteine methyltransferase